MIISVEKVKTLIELDGWTDEKIAMKLDAIEQTIRAYTNNNFQARGHRIRADIQAGVFVSESLVPFEVDDTVQVSGSRYSDGLYAVVGTFDTSFMVSNEPRLDEECVTVTKVVYPADVVACAVNLLDWEKHNRDKVGISSETLSRHSVSYFAQDANNQLMGYPISLLGCLKAYRKARC